MQCDSNGYRQYCNADTQGRVVLLRERSPAGTRPSGSRLGLRQRRHRRQGPLRRIPATGATTVRRGPACRFGVKATATAELRYCVMRIRRTVSLIREMSTGNPCQQGRALGLLNNGGIWVDKGCRGEFRYGQDSSRRNDAAVAAGIIGALWQSVRRSARRRPQLPAHHHRRRRDWWQPPLPLWVL